MTSPELEVEIAALLSFNTDEDLNYLNDLAARAKEAGYSEEWTLTAPVTPAPFRQQSKPSTFTKPQARARYLLKLEEPFETAEKIAAFAGLLEIPAIRGHEDDLVRFCEMDGVSRRQFAAALDRQGLAFDPFFMQYTVPATKDLHRDSLYPTLGVESTLPQYRAASQTVLYLPLQDEYPVWYFVYGTLRNTSRLAQVLQVSEYQIPLSLPARVWGGQLHTWGGKYQALVDGMEWIDGQALHIRTQEDESALRSYETENYEVVRCKIWMGNEFVFGCTFRFIGDID